jgi:hypothetical protein
MASFVVTPVDYLTRFAIPDVIYVTDIVVLRNDLVERSRNDFICPQGSDHVVGVGFHIEPVNDTMAVVIAVGLSAHGMSF